MHSPLPFTLIRFLSRVLISMPHFRYIESVGVNNFPSIPHLLFLLIVRWVPFKVHQRFLKLMP